MDYLKVVHNMVQSQHACGRKFLTFVIYMTILLDNILLTVIVPILPDYLSQIDNDAVTYSNLQDSLKYKNLYMHYVSNMFGDEAPSLNQTLDQNFHFDVAHAKLWNGNKLNEENSAVGILLATKAFVQLIMTPVIKTLINSYGYRIPTVLGTFVLFLASFIFAIGQSYFLLILARAMQGFASACISVCGMSIIAQIYPEEKIRSQVIGIVLGSMALGVLLGYPFGGILYAFYGKSAPFYIISILTFVILALQLIYMDLQYSKGEVKLSETNYSYFLTDPNVVKIILAIFISTIAMATLEPCLPIWLMSTLKPEKWQIGTVFIPDSIGYFVSTNFFALCVHQSGRMQMAIIALIVVGVSCFVIPHAYSIFSLAFPHFALGMGIGTLDVALVPLLASIADSKYVYEDETSSVVGHSSSYGGIYALQQISVSMAYCLGPLLGGEIAQYIGFSWLMSLIGLVNICYGVFLTMHMLREYQLQICSDDESEKLSNGIFLNMWPSKLRRSNDSEYKRFYSSVDMP